MGFPQNIRFTPEEERILDEINDKLAAEYAAKAEAERVAAAVAAGYPEAVARAGERTMALYDVWQARQGALDRGGALPPLPDMPSATAWQPDLDYVAPPPPPLAPDPLREALEAKLARIRASGALRSPDEMRQWWDFFADPAQVLLTKMSYDVAVFTVNEPERP